MDMEQISSLSYFMSTTKNNLGESGGGKLHSTNNSITQIPNNGHSKNVLENISLSERPKRDAASVFMSVNPHTVGDKRWKRRKVAVSNSCANTEIRR